MAENGATDPEEKKAEVAFGFYWDMQSKKKETIKRIVYAFRDNPQGLVRNQVYGASRISKPDTITAHLNTLVSWECLEMEKIGDGSGDKTWYQLNKAGCHLSNRITSTDEKVPIDSEVPIRQVYVPSGSTITCSVKSLVPCFDEKVNEQWAKNLESEIKHTIDAFISDHPFMVTNVGLIINSSSITPTR